MMYFTVAEARCELEAILSGQYLGREDSEFYPIGRCALWKGMRELYDPDGILQSFKNRLAEYPRELALKGIDHHLKALQDVEDLQRAVQRKMFLFSFCPGFGPGPFLNGFVCTKSRIFSKPETFRSFYPQFNLKPADCVDQLQEARSGWADKQKR